MPSNRLTILAINPGTRYIGFAVLRGTVLVDWGVSGLSGSLSDDKAKRALSLVANLITENRPSVLVLKTLHPSRRSAHLYRLWQGVQRLAQSDGLDLRYYSIHELEACFSPTSRINRNRLAELVSETHPVLRHELRKEQDSYNAYHIRMFEAVALAVAAHNAVEQKPPTA